MIAASSNDARRFREWIASRLGLQFEDAKLDFLADILSGRAHLRSQSPASYLDDLGQSAVDAERHALISELTVPETYFFRHVEQFRAFAEVALPQAMAACGAERRLRVLSVGCASGEEPYSLLMWAKDNQTAGSMLDVMALDLNPAMLAKAARALYSPWALRETSKEAQDRWFTPVGAQFELHAAIRNGVRFQQCNLSQENAEIWLPNHYDIIFCRNVLMYFTPQVMRAVVSRITHALTPGGHLFLGHAETLRGLSHDFHLCHTHDTFYYQRKHKARHEHPSGFESSDKAAPIVPSAVPMSGTAWLEAIQNSSERIYQLTRSFAPDASARQEATSRSDVEAELKLALELLKKERFVEALDLLKRLPPVSAQEVEVLLLRAALLTHSGQLGEAEKVSALLLEQDELNAGAHYLLALCRESAGDVQGALDHDQAAIYLDAEFAMPQLHIGLMARRGGDWAGARAALDNALPLLKREDDSRLLLFGGGFCRDGLIALCRAELDAARSRA